MLRSREARSKAIDSNALKALLTELEEFSAEFDTSSAEAMQLLLDEHITTLMKQGYMTDRLAAPDLEDVLAHILHGQVSEDLLSSAETMRRLIESYGDTPSYDDMEEAYSLLGEIIEGIRQIAKRMEHQ
jgi:hypothetical protein